MDQVALKIHRWRYLSEALREVVSYQRFREATVACPEIINLREVFMHDGHVCMAFEKHGNSLAAALDRGAISPARARRATRQVLIALDQLHRSGYAHTDVKPDNILYSPRTGDARLADLGDAVERLRRGTLYGTREYTPPEVLLGTPLARSLDMWSVGCTVFEMLTARVLFNPRAAAAKSIRSSTTQAEKVCLWQRLSFRITPMKKPNSWRKGPLSLTSIDWSAFWVRPL